MMNIQDYIFLYRYTIIVLFYIIYYYEEIMIVNAREIELEFEGGTINVDSGNIDFELEDSPEDFLETIIDDIGVADIVTHIGVSDILDEIPTKKILETLTEDEILEAISITDFVNWNECDTILKEMDHDEIISYVIENIPLDKISEQITDIDFNDQTRILQKKVSRLNKSIKNKISEVVNQEFGED